MLAALMAATMCIAAPAGASVALDYVGMNTSLRQTVRITVYNNDSHTVKWEDVNVYAGIMQIRLNGGPLIDTFCLDLADFSGDDDKAEMVALENAPDAWAGPMGQTAADTIKSLWASYRSGISTSLEAAALQIAVWETIDRAMAYDVVFSGNDAAVNRANYMLDHLGNARANLMAVSSSAPNPEVQDFIVPVPEPTTLIAGALLLVPFGLSTIRRRSQR